MYKIIYIKKAINDLKGLEPGIARRIVKKIHFFSCQENPLAYAKKLSQPEIGQYRFRIGDYRALFDIDANGRIQILMILRIKHRKDIYGL